MENKKDNKNTKRIGIAIIVLLLLLAIGATAGITLAKYISSATVQSQTATAAKWGYTLTADASGMFGTNYGAVKDNFATVVESGGVVVSSTSNANVVAPGTKGEAKLVLNGSGEVNAVLTITVSDSFKTIHLTDNNGLNYYPVKWKVNGTEVTAESNTMGANDFAKAIVTALNKTGVLPTGITATAKNNVVTVELPANTNITDLKLEISWEWAYRTAKSGSSGEYYDAEDTILGQIAQAGKIETTGSLSGYAGSSWQLAFGFSADIEQVQQFPSEQQNP
ncbi:MAG: hypothetical protein J1G02_02880 [Clostridiales bacterium]|nr:hypothetical protein [Clostridiales bacterium]